MFRLCLLQRYSLLATTLPPNFISTGDLAFYFPRFQPETHIQSAGIAEIEEALTLIRSQSVKVVLPTPVDAPASHWRSRAFSTPQSATVRRWLEKVSSAEEAVKPGKEKVKCLSLLDRGIDILEGAGGLSSPVVAPLLRPVFAAKFELLHGTAHLPRPPVAVLSTQAVGSSQRYRGGALNVAKHILYHSSRLLVNKKGWDVSDSGALTPHAIDTDCVILAHFVKAFCALHTRPFHLKKEAVTSAKPKISSSIKKEVQRGGQPAASSSPPPWSLSLDGDTDRRMTLDIVLERIDQLMRRCEAAMAEVEPSHQKKEAMEGSTMSNGFDWESWKLYIPKLLLLKALMTIANSGHLLQAKQYLDEAVAYVNRLQKRSHIVLDGLRSGQHPAEPEMGLFWLAQAELMARIWDWSGGRSRFIQKPNGEKVSSAELDEDVFDAFENAAGFYAAPFSTSTKGDEIMNLERVSEREFEVHAYVVCLVSLATVLLRVPRPPTSLGVNRSPQSQSDEFSAVHRDSKPVFLPQQLFSLQPPFFTVHSPSPIIFTDSSRLRPFTVEEARRNVGVLLKRALELVRALYPNDRDHPLSAHILSVMASLYADTRDYLYASGLFESARRAVNSNYGGPLSLEGVFVEKLRYEFLAGVGSAEEAKSAAHEIVQHLKQIDSFPVK